MPTVLVSNHQFSLVDSSAPYIGLDYEQSIDVLASM